MRIKPAEDVLEAFIALYPGFALPDRRFSHLFDGSQQCRPMLIDQHFSNQGTQQTHVRTQWQIFFGKIDSTDFAHGSNITKSPRDCGAGFGDLCYTTLTCMTPSAAEMASMISRVGSVSTSIML